MACRLHTAAMGSVGSVELGWLASALGTLERTQPSLLPARAMTSLLLPYVGWVWSLNTQVGHGTGQQRGLLGTVASGSWPLAAPLLPPVQAEPWLHSPQGTGFHSATPSA